MTILIISKFYIAFISSYKDWTTPTSLTSFSTRDDISMLLYHAGFTNEALTPQTREKAIQRVLLHQVFRSRRE
jgi:hypothetical protein